MFKVEQGLLYRIFQPKKQIGELCRQLVVPLKFRNQVLELAHEHILVRHLGARKALEKVSRSFYWPGVSGDVKVHVGTCHICQKERYARDQHPHPPLLPITAEEEPYIKVGIDFLGPLARPSRSGGEMDSHSSRLPLRTYHCHSFKKILLR